jgi:hypothetical protein
MLRGLLIPIDIQENTRVDARDTYKVTVETFKTGS